MDDFPLEYLPFPACILTRRGVLQKVNGPFAELLGYGEAEVFQGLPLGELFQPDSGKPLEELLAGSFDREGSIDEKIPGTLHDLLGNHVRLTLIAKSSGEREHIYLRLASLPDSSREDPGERYRCRLADILLNSTEFSSAYEAILQLLLEETFMEAGAVLLGTDEPGSLEICASSALYPELESILRDESMGEWRGVKKILFFGRGPEETVIPPVLRMAGVKSAVLLPVFTGDQQQLLYVLFSRSKTGFLPGEEEALRILYDCVRRATERLLREQILTKGKKLYQSLLRSMPSGLIVKELEEARQRAEEADRGKSRFLANFSHEIRTPLSGIMGMTDILLMADLEPEQREQLLLMKEAEDSLLDIINKILDLSRIEAGKVKIRNEVFHLGQTLKRVITPFIVKQPPPRLEFQVVLSEDIPEYLIGDEAHLQLILANLLENAAKFTETGSIVLSARMHRAMEGTLVPLLFSVSDTGRGIPRDAQERIFENFQQLDSSFSKEHKGTGLGLSICKQLVEQMGGSIWLESEPGKGSTFYFDLELRKAAESEIDDPGLVSVDLAFDRADTPLDILLVEDNILNQEAIGHLLRNRGHRLTLSANGEEALKALKGSRFDLVLMDIQMPKMNGIDAAREIRGGEIPGIDPHIPIVALTAYAMENEVKIILEAGMNAYVSKPVNRKELLDTIEKIIWEKTPKPSVSAVSGNPLLPDLEYTPAGDMDFRSFLEDYRNDIDVARRLLELFSRDLPGKIESLRSALERKDRQTLIDNFHSLTNNLSAVRLYALGRQSRDMEKLAVLEEYQVLRKKFPVLDVELAHSLAEARTYLLILRGMK
jgi:signal transduction histidine kinase/DNA-binding response OmpR family regulator